MRQSKVTHAKAERAQDLAQWFREHSQNGGEADLMVRAARALERIAAGPQAAFANDNSTLAGKRARH